MRISILSISLGLSIVSCARLGDSLDKITQGKSCIQSWGYFAEVENRTGADQNLSMVYYGDKMAVVETEVAIASGTKQTFVRGIFQAEKKGTMGKGGPEDAVCSENTAKANTPVYYLDATSFSLVKNCVDPGLRFQILVTVADTCPSGTTAQPNPL
jgi:hypothetical protein